MAGCAFVGVRSVQEHRSFSEVGSVGRFMRISLGSATELEYHLLLSRDIQLLDAATHTRLSAQARRIQGMLAGLKRALNSHSSRRSSKSRGQ
jgi:four helix bundle protein